MKTIKLLFSAIALFLSTTGCMQDFIVRGNGIEITEGRTTPDFNKVKSSGDFVIHITNGDELEVVVIAEQNIIHYIETSVSGNTLNIEIRGMHNIKNQLPMEVYITTPDLEGIKQSGSGLITTSFFTTDQMHVSISGSGMIKTDVDTDNIKASISGSGKLQLSGTANDGWFDISGSGKIESYDLEMINCSAKISGSGDMRLNASDNLHATISGSGNIFYLQNPRVETHISGSGKVIHEN